MYKTTIHMNIGPFSTPDTLAIQLPYKKSKTAKVSFQIKTFFWVWISKVTVVISSAYKTHRWESYIWYWWKHPEFFLAKN